MAADASSSAMQMMCTVCVSGMIHATFCMVLLMGVAASHSQK